MIEFNYYMDIKVTPKELQVLRARLRIERRKTGCPRAALKLNVIINLAKGMSYSEMAYALEIDDNTVKNYLNRYNEGKLQALLDDNHQGKHSLLSKIHKEQLKIEIRETLYRTTGAVQRVEPVYYE